MKKFALTILLTLLASPAWATTYYLAPASGGGNDSNNGTSASTPWLTPNHPVNCGDVILATASAAYLNTGFAPGDWGRVTCAGGNNVAWLKCVTFDACKMSTSNTDGIVIDQSYWGVQGWEVDGQSAAGACFYAYPNNSVEIHHIIFANDIANGCAVAGFGFANASSSAGVDYFVVVGSIAYNAAGGNANCNSGIDLLYPVNSDSLPGTHIYVAGNFTYNNVDGTICLPMGPTDGEGIIFDTFSSNSYTGQSLADNNIAVYNGGRGILVYSNTLAPIYFRHNTVFGNNTQTGQPSYVGKCGEIELNTTVSTRAFLNIAQTNSPAGCDSNTVYAYWATSVNGTDQVYQNNGYDASGNNGGSSSSAGLSYGTNNVFGTNPSFSNPVDPGAPSCGSAASVPNCMATVVANFTPTTPAAKVYGYQIPSRSQTYDPLFPQWVCNVNLPAGLVTMGCLPASALPAAPTITSVTVK